MLNPRLLLLAVIAISLLPAPALWAERVVLEKPVEVRTVKADKKPLDGKLIAWDEEGFELVTGKDRFGKDKVTKVKWDELAAPGLFNVFSTVIGPKGTAEQWLDVGKTLLKVEGGEKFADRAFARALKLDPSVQEQVDAVRKGGEGGEAAGAGKREEAGDAAGDEAAANSSEAGAGSEGGPRMVGKSDGKAWPKLTEEQQAAAVAELKAFAAAAGKKLNKELTLHETKYFLFYTDLPEKEGKDWSVLLDRMYGRLADLFGVARDAKTRGRENVWYGKALVFVFKSADDYRSFQSSVHETDAGSSQGMCHCFSDGRVHIGFYRQNDKYRFAHVLVHESVHGFLHRFRSPQHVPSWANEGLAEVIASELVAQPGFAKVSEASARHWLRQHGGMRGMFKAKPIEGWQYPVAETLCAFMIRQSKSRYVNFIIGMKEGLTWEQSLEQRYKTTPKRLVQAYGEAMGVKPISE